MANFGVQATELSGPSAAGSAPLKPVQGPSDTFNMSWLGAVEPLAKGLMSLGTGKDRLGTAVEEYSIGLNKLNQASTTGAMSSSEADRRRRELWSTVQTKYSDVSATAMQQAFSKQFTAAKDASGISEEMDRAKQMRQREDDLVFEGAKLGIYDTRFATNPETRDMALDMMQTYNSQQRELELATKQADRSRKMIENGQSDMTFQHKQDTIALEKAGTEFFQKNGTKYGGVLGALTDTLVQRVKSGELTGEDAIAQIQSQVSAYQGQAEAALANNPALQTKLTQYMASFVDNAKFQMDPKNITSYTQSRNVLAVEQRKAALTSQEDYITTLSAFKGLVGETAFAQVASLEVSTRLLGNFANVAANGNTRVVQEGNKEVQKATYGSLNKAVTSIASGASVNQVADTADVEKHTKAIIKDLGRVRQGDPVKLTETVNFLAGPTVKYLIDQGKLSPTDMMEAGEVYKGLYRQDLMGQVSNILHTNVEQGPVKGYKSGNVPLSNLVDFNVDAAGVVSMVPKWDDKDFNNQTAMQMRAIQSVREINSKMSGINTAVKMGAHMEGRTDYKKYFEENASLFLPTFFPNKQFIEEQTKAGYKYLGGNRYNPRNWTKSEGAKNE